MVQSRQNQRQPHSSLGHLTPNEFADQRQKQVVEDITSSGYARDPRARERAHNSGHGAKYTAGRRPVRLVYQQAFRSMGKALAREYVVKQLTRAQKDALVVSARRRHR